MSHITGKFEPDGIIILQGFRFFGNSTDLILNYTSGRYRYLEDRFNCEDAGILTVEASAAGKVRLDIIEIGITANDSPTIKKGAEVASDPEYPAVSADHARISAIGTVAKPITETATKLVYTTAGAGEVELQDQTSSFRL